jgi:hypothetical protein
MPLLSNLYSLIPFHANLIWWDGAFNYFKGKRGKFTFKKIHNTRLYEKYKFEELASDKKIECLLRLSLYDP